MIGNTRHVVNMANSVVGVSILSMPYCFKEAGLLLGVVMVLFSGVVTKKTCMFLVRAATMARHHSYEFLAFHVFGVRGKLAVELCMILFLIGICISFHVVMGDLAPALVASVLDLHNTSSLRATLLLGIALLVVLPLCLLRKLDNLASMSVCSILFYFFLITVIFWHAFPRLVDGSWYHLARLWRPAGVLQVFPICMLGLSCQSNVFEIYDSVQDADVPKMRSVVNQALNLCCALYIAVGFFGYIAFVDQDMAGNIIMNLPATPLTEGIKLFFTASLAISFPLMIFPCRTSIHSLVYCRNTQGYDLVRNYMPEARFKGITVGILAVSLVVGILIPNIEFVLGMLGSTMGVVISLVLPCVMFIKVNSKASIERLVAQGIMLMGVLLIVSGTYLNLTHSQQGTVAVVEAAQQPVIAMPPALLHDDIPLEKEGGGVLLARREEEEDAAAGGVQEDKGGPAGDRATRREPVAPEPPPEDKVVVVKEKNKDKDKVDERAAAAASAKKESVGEGGGPGDTLHPDAIQKEEKEVHREGDGAAGAEAGGAGAGARVESKQQELLQKIEVQHKEQQKILEEQKKILKELKDQKAQQELAQSLRAAAAAPQQQLLVNPQQLPAAAAAPQQQPQQQLLVNPQQLPAAAAAPQQQLLVNPQQLPAAAAAAPQQQQLLVNPQQLPAAAGGGAPQQPPQEVLVNAQLPAAPVPQQPQPPPPQQVLVNVQPVPAGVPQLPAAQQSVAALPQPAALLQQQQQVVAAPPQPGGVGVPQVSASQQSIAAAPPPQPGGAVGGNAAAAGVGVGRGVAVPQQLPGAADGVAVPGGAGGVGLPASPPAVPAAPVVAVAPKMSPSPPPAQLPEKGSAAQLGEKASAGQLPHYPAAPRPSQHEAKKGPDGYLEKVAEAGRAKPHHDEERRKRAVVGLGPELEGDLPKVELGGVAAGLSEAAYESRHLLWGNSRTRRRKRRGGQRGGDEEYWDET